MTWHRGITTFAFTKQINKYKRREKIEKPFVKNIKRKNNLLKEKNEMVTVFTVGAFW